MRTLANQIHGVALDTPETAVELAGWVHRIRELGLFPL